MQAVVVLLCCQDIHTTHRQLGHELGVVHVWIEGKSFPLVVTKEM